MAAELNAIWFVPPAIHRAAESQGFLAAHDVVVDGVLTGSSDQQFEALRAGTSDVAITAMDNVIVWNRREGGGDFRIIAQVEADTGNTLMSRADIGSIRDLAGKRLLVDSAENGFVVALRALLADAGVSFDGCTIVRAGGVRDRFAAMLAGEGDATLLGPPFVELGEQAGLHVLARVNEAYPTFPGQGIVVRESFLAAHGERVVRWLAALEQGRAHCRSDPAATAAALAAGGIPAESARVLADFVGETLAVSRAGVELLLDQRRSLGLLGSDATLAELVNSEPLAKALSLRELQHSRGAHQ